MRVVLIVLAFLILFFLILTVYHQFMLDQERTYRQPIAEMVQLDKGRMSVYRAGKGEKTLVFLSGGGIPSPILDFRPLTNVLEEEFQVVVVEKFGYGFSDDIVEERSLSSILEDTRSALATLGISESVILVPHSMSGLEALYWAQSYPDEVEAIIGLDMSLPISYEEAKTNHLLLEFAALASTMGLIRLFSDLFPLDALEKGQLTKEEKQIYQSLLYHRTLSHAVRSEALHLKQNAERVSARDIPAIPYLLVVSNGKDTGFSQEKWRDFSRQFTTMINSAEGIEVDSPHSIHNHIPEELAKKISNFVNQLE